MSGHSKWENIKRKKGSEDAKRGKIFSKFSRAITAAVKEGGSSDPDSNIRLKVLIEQARDANMPKDNIERAIKGAEKSASQLESFVLEGYGPSGVAIMINALSDSRQRTIQELKNLFSRFNGNMAEPGAVSFQFDQFGMIEVEKIKEDLILEVMDKGVSDFEEKEDKTVFYMPASNLSEVAEFLEGKKIKILKRGVVMKAKNLVSIENGSERKSVLSLLEELEESDDVQQVFSNLEI